MNLLACAPAGMTESFAITVVESFMSFCLGFNGKALWENSSTGSKQIDAFVKQSGEALQIGSLCSKEGPGSINNRGNDVRWLGLNFYTAKHDDID